MALHLQLHKLPPSTFVVQLLLCLLLLSSSSHPILKPCTCSAAEPPDPSYSLTVHGALDQLPGYLFLTNNMSTCTTNCWQRVASLASYIKANHPALNLSQEGWFFVRQLIVLQVFDSFRTYEVPFSVGFSMSIYQPNNEMKAATSSRLIFALQPYPAFDSWGIFTPQNWEALLGPYNPTSRTGSDGSRISVQIGTARDNTTLMYVGGTVWAQIGIEPPGNSTVAETKQYSVWIDYDHVRHRVTVYVDAGEGRPKPANAIASKRVFIDAKYALLGLFSSVGQLLQVHTWNSTVDWLPSSHHMPVIKEDTIGIILLTVIVSAAATAITTILVFLYINSKYRRWKKEQDELTKIMQGIPGMPTHVDFTVIMRTTNNFHETMKLGKGGFGAVYRCTLPAVASRTGRAMDVAVKKFTRDVEDRRYSDFLAEVSIINRLRHKNIVPLVGEWILFLANKRHNNHALSQTSKMARANSAGS